MVFGGGMTTHGQSKRSLNYGRSPGSHWPKEGPPLSMEFQQSDADQHEESRGQELFTLREESNYA